jgi:hypothetical protein
MPEQASIRPVKTVCLLLLCFAAAAFAASEEPITRKWLEKSLFQSIRVKPSQPPQLLLQFKANGTRFLCLRNGQEDKVSDYGETMSVNLGETFSLSEHHSGLEFRPLPKPLDKNGWLIEWQFDARSFGGRVTDRYGILLILKTSVGAELRFVEPRDPFDPKLPPTDPTYQTILKLIAEIEPLVRHELTGETPSGIVPPPFSKATTALVFRWEMKPGGDANLLGVRWVASAVSGVEKNHLIATAKSEPGKTSGLFTLKKPTAGFPPGQYRVEIWQAGKTIYGEEFQIR